MGMTLARDSKGDLVGNISDPMVCQMLGFVLTNKAQVRRF